MYRACVEMKSASYEMYGGFTKHIKRVLKFKECHWVSLRTYKVCTEMQRWCGIHITQDSAHFESGSIIEHVLENVYGITGATDLSSS